MGNNAKKRPAKKQTALTADQRADAGRLRALWKQFQAEHKFATQEWLGEQLGITQGAIHQYLQAKIPIGMSFLLAVARILRVDPAQISPRLAAEIPYKAFPAATGKMGKNNNSVEPGGRLYFDLVPLLSSWVAAGTGEVTINKQASRDRYAGALPCPAKHGPHTFALKVEGVSMEDPRGPLSFRAGDIIFVDPDVVAQSGDCVVAQLVDAASMILKQLLIEGGRRYIKSLNPSWPEPMIELPADAIIHGVVIFSGRETRVAS